MLPYQSTLRSSLRRTTVLQSSLYTTMESAYVKSAQDVLRHFDVDEQSGLSDSRVQQQLSKFGKNGLWPMETSRPPSRANRALQSPS